MTSSQAKALAEWKAVKAAALPWTQAQAVAEFPSLSELAEQCGYRAALLGSVLTRGGGRDLDVVLLPLRGADQDPVEFLQRFGGRLVRNFWSPLRNVHHTHVEKDGRLYDFVFGDFWSLRR